MAYMKSVLTSLFFCVLLAAPSVRAAQPRGQVELLKYMEEGQWYVHSFTEDSEGWPETLEKKAFPTEALASIEIKKLKASTGAVEVDAQGNDNPLELNNPLLGEIWTAKNEWSEEWESKFSEWVRNNFNKKFFKKYNIKTDCADAAVAIRWIYSRMMSLPAGNTLTFGGVMMTNRSLRSTWKDLPTSENWYDDRRFMTALDYLLLNTYTHSLQRDAYPIKISPTYLTEGTFHLEMREEDGHTRVISKIDRDTRNYPITDLYSNVPRVVRTLAEEPFTVSEQPEMRVGGFMKHRWTKFSGNEADLVPANMMPGYSLEQYRPEFFTHGIPNFSAEVVARFQEAFDPVMALEALFKNIKNSMRDRIDVVASGYSACQKVDCSPGSSGYENWSTPSRDGRLLGYFKQIQNYLKTLSGDELTRFAVRYKQELSRKYIKIDRKKYLYQDLEEIWTKGLYSSNPKDPPQRRWGLN